jgi:uncharacterized protein (DUF1499 family)
MTRGRGYNADMRVSLAAVIVAAVALLLLVVAGPGYRIGLFSLELALLGLLPWAAYAGAAGIVLSAIALYWGRRHTLRGAQAMAVLALLTSLVAVAVPFEFQRRARAVPPIHDISTDLENPPAFKAILPLRADAPNALDRPADVNDRQRTGYPDLQPVTLPDPPERAFDAALQTAQAMDWEIVSADKSSGMIEATDTTTWFGFKDDVAVRLTPWGSGTRVDLRSVSRVGISDIGTNARRIQAFLEALRK